MANTKPQWPNCYITFHPQTFDTLQRITNATGLSTSQIVEQLLNTHMRELYEYADWIEHQGGGTWERGVDVLARYGPHSLTTEMQRLDPTYHPPRARVRADRNNKVRFDEADMAALHAILQEWKPKQAGKGARQ
jgi:hypothetical protein